jgi:hypothetical protein
MMKKTLLALIVVLTGFTVQAQLNPVSWTFSVQKTADKTYEVHMKATVQAGWHLYSQTQPEDAIAIPTKFTINPNPLLTADGKITEKGKMEKFHDAKLDISAHQYSGNVEFVQVVKLKANAKTNVTGTVEYQTCNDQRCLPVKSVPFSVAIK